MKSIITCICVLMTISHLASQESIFPKQMATDLTHIAISGDNIFTVGTCSRAQVSTDGGSTWDIFDIEIEEFWTGLEIKPNSNGNESYLLHDDILLIFNIDKSLTEVNTSILEGFGRMRSMEIDDNYIYIVSDGAIHKAPHGSLEWEHIVDVVYDSPYTISTSAISPTSIYVTSREGHVFETNKTSGGYVEVSNINGWIRTMTMANDDVGYLTAQGASGPYKTIDGGNTWVEIQDWPENNPVRVYNEDIIMTSNTNRFFVSTDGGATNTANYMSDDIHAGLIYNTRFDEDGNIYMVGESSMVLRSSDLGETYDNLIPNIRTHLNNIHFNANSGISTGYGSILISNDAGENWEEYSDANIENPSDGVVLADGKFAIASHSGVSIVNNGVVESTAGARADRIYVAPDNSYLLASLVIGSSYVMSKSSDNGLTWENKRFNDQLGRIKSNSAGLIYAVSGDGKYIYSTDEGETWDEKELPIIGWMSDIVIEDGVELYNLNGDVYESKDNGITLTEIGGGQRVNNLHILREDHYTYTNGSSVTMDIKEKKPGATSFSTIASSCGTAYGSYNKGNGEVWYSKSAGYIAKFDFDLVTSTIDRVESNPDIYPNPIVSGEEIMIDGITNPSTISITNIMGKQILNRVVKDHSTTINTEELIPGNYYISIKTDNRMTTSKIMVF